MSDNDHDDADNGDLRRSVDRLQAENGDLRDAYERLETRAVAADTDAAKLASAVGWLLACLADPEANRYDGATSRAAARQFVKDHEQLVDART